MISKMVKPRSKLHHADILLRCSKAEHENCAVMRDSLMEKFDNVTMAYTTRTVLNGIDYCVSASAIVKEGKVNDFKNKLKKFEGKSPNKFKVKFSEVLVNNH